MTDDHDLDRLDARAHRAATDLHTRVAARPAPAFDVSHAALVDAPAVRDSGRRAQRLLAVAAIVLVVAAAAGIWLAESGDDDPADVRTTEPHPFVAGTLPKGFTLLGAGEISAADAVAGAGQTIGVGPVQLYGPSTDDPQLGVASFPSWDAATAGGIDPIQVEGRTMYPFDGLGLGPHAIIVEVDDLAVALVSRTRNSDWLQAVGAEVSVAEDGSVDLHGFQLPEDWQELGQVPDLLVLANPALATSTGRAGKYVLYQHGGFESVGATDSGAPATTSTTSATPPPTGEVGSITVSSTPGDEVALHARVLVADRSSAVAVRGHDGVLTATAPSAGSPETITVSWIEAPGELVTVSGSGITEPELLDVAEGLQPVGAAAWTDLLERSQLGEFDPANAQDPPKTKIGSGRFADGSKWVLAFSVTGTGAESSISVDLAVAVASPGDSSSSSTSGQGSGIGASGAPILSTQIEDQEDRSFGAALVSGAVDHVEVRDRQGTVLARPEIIEGGGQRGVAVDLPDGASVLVAFDAQGDELGRSDFARGSSGSSGSGSGSGSATATTIAGG